MSEDLWSNPQHYKPSRFLQDNVRSDRRDVDYNNGDNYENNNTINYHHNNNIESDEDKARLTFNKVFKKPAHFHPFSMGRRSCMGYKIVQNVSYSIVASLLQHFTFDAITEKDISTTKNPEIPLGMLALAPQPFCLRLTKRQEKSGSFYKSLPLETNSKLRTRA